MSLCPFGRIDTQRYAFLVQLAAATFGPYVLNSLDCITPSRSLTFTLRTYLTKCDSVEAKEKRALLVTGFYFNTPICTGSYRFIPKRPNLARALSILCAMMDLPARDDERASAHVVCSLVLDGWQHTAHMEQRLANDDVCSVMESVST